VTDIPPDPRIGTTVGGKYRIVAVLGRGGMGTVYRAIHRDLGEPVAVKFLHGMFANDPELLARFRREALALARLRHPGIVSLLDVSAPDEEPFMVMELVAGHSLQTELSARPGTLALPRIGDILCPLLEVLELAHEQGIVHRDVKPSNVMLLDGDHVKLLDFGLVHLPGKDLKQLTATGMVVGTPDYMAPEQCDGQPTGPPVDIYAVGVMLFEALAGRLPFEASGPGALMAAHLFIEPPTIAERSLGRAVSQAFEDLVKRALSKAPEARPTALEMRQELTAILKGTDPLTLAEQAGRERIRLGTLSRSERAFTGSRLDAPPPQASMNLALLVLDDEQRASSIKGALWVAGVHARVLRRDAPPGETVGVPAAIIVSWEDERKHAQPLAWLAEAHPGVPVLVIDVADADAAALVIRAGASDMALAGFPNSELARKIARLARRRR
jgi:serine/threonine-protein kinase